jgi:hypothetical protein
MFTAISTSMRQSKYLTKSDSCQCSTLTISAKHCSPEQNRENVRKAQKTVFLLAFKPFLERCRDKCLARFENPHFIGLLRGPAGADVSADKKIVYMRPLWACAYASDCIMPGATQNHMKTSSPNTRRLRSDSRPQEEAVSEAQDQQKFVNILTGEIVVAALVEDGRFWRHDELDKNGRPLRRCRGELCQISPSTHGSYFTGSYAPFSPSRESETEPLRRRIFELRTEANRLKTQLCSLYLKPVQNEN